MSDLDTRIEGSPSSIESAATWLRDTLATALDSTAGSMTSGRSTAQTSWKASAGEAFASTIETGISEVDDLEGSARAMATDLEEFAHSLRTCQSDMSTARTEASAEGVVVDGWTIVDPGAGPAFPSGTGYGTPEEVAVYEREISGVPSPCRARTRVPRGKGRSRTCGPQVRHCLHEAHGRLYGQ